MRRLPLALLLGVLLSSPVLAQPLVTITVYEDGSVHVVHKVPVEPPGVVIVELVGTPSYLLVAESDGKPLPFNLTGRVLTTFTLESREVVVVYDVEDLAIETEGVWRLELPDLDARIVLELPNGTVVVYVDPLPAAIESTDGGLKLEFDEGPVTVEYFVYVEEKPQRTIPAIMYAIPLIVILVVVTAVVLRLRHKPPVPLTEEEEAIVRFVKARGGRAYQSEIRDYLGLPTTTVWRRIKRLEELGIVEVERTPRGNLVKLKK